MYSLLLAGGGGTRLWPLSTKEYPKQFVVIEGDKYSLFQNTVLRCAKFTDSKHIIILTGDVYKEEIIKQAKEVGVEIPEENILCEPMPKGTLPAVMLGVTHIKEDCTVAVFPCDHSIIRTNEFEKAVSDASSVNGRIVTFGIKPDRPETAYGYIKPSYQEGVSFKAERFCEKPDEKTAAVYMNEGYLWNSGMFIFDRKLFLDEVEKHAPEVFDAFLNPETAFYNTPSVSIDVGVMEKSDRVNVIPVDLGWSDLGGFKAVYDYKSDIADENGNVLVGNSAVLDCENCLVYSTGEKIRVMGLSDIVVVSHNGQILISKADKLSKIKEISEK